MEILHAFGVEWKLLAIQGLNFLVVLFVLHRYAYKPIITIIEKRANLIAEGVKAAEQAKIQEEKIAQEKAGILLLAREEGGKIVDTLRKQALEQERSILRSAEEKGHIAIADAMTRAEGEREYILRESEKDIARMAVLAAEKVLQGKAQGV